MIIASFDLPDDVFQPGEKKPLRPKKKVIKKSDTSGHKRSIDSLDVSANKIVKVYHEAALAHVTKCASSRIV